MSRPCCNFGWRDRNNAVANEAPETGVTRRDDDLSIGNLVDLVKTYAKQQTIGPLRNAGRWLSFGVAGAILLGVGLMLVLLGLLRLIQTEWEWAATGSWSWISYLLVLVACVLVVVVAVSRISKSSLSKEYD